MRRGNPHRSAQSVCPGSGHMNPRVRSEGPMRARARPERDRNPLPSREEASGAGGTAAWRHVETARKFRVDLRRVPEPGRCVGIFPDRCGEDDHAEDGERHGAGADRSLHARRGNRWAPSDGSRDGTIPGGGRETATPMDRRRRYALTWLDRFRSRSRPAAALRSGVSGSIFPDEEISHVPRR